MAEYIEREAAIEYLKKHKKQGLETLIVLRADEDAIIKFLKEKCPAADVVPRAEVARKIFAEMDEILEYWYSATTDTYGGEIYTNLEKLKKKYTEGE